MKLDKFSFYVPELNDYRVIRVLYPEDRSKRYPVLYVHDGTYCFRKDTPPSYECMSLDEALQNQSREMIVVTIEAPEWQERTKDYSPFYWVGEAASHLPQGQQRGEVYISFIVHVLKPFIDTKYPSNPSYLTTYMLGCSLGAQISLYASCAFPNVFSKIGLCSLASWGNQKAMLDYIRSHHPNINTSYFMRVGTNEGTPRNFVSLKDCYVRISQEIKNCLTDEIKVAVDFKINPGRQHKTAEWAKDMPDFINFLFK